MKLFKDFKRTESDLFAKIKNVMTNAGILIRLENLIVPGLPDCIFIFARKIILIELKILRSGKIHMPKWQYSIAVDMHKYIDPNAHWYFIYEDDGVGGEIISAYRFADLIHLLPEHGDTDRKTVTLDIRRATPVMVFNKSNDIQDWLEMLSSKGTTW